MLKEHSRRGVDGEMNIFFGAMLYETVSILSNGTGKSLHAKTLGDLRLPSDNHTLKSAILVNDIALA